VIEKYSVIITAGGRIEGDFARHCGTEIKALIDIKGETIVSRVIKAFKESNYIKEIILVGPKELNNLSLSVDKILPEGESGIDNIFIGLKAVKEKGKVILSSSDMPLVTTSDIEEFLRLCPSDASVCYPVFEKNYYLSVLPDTRSDFVRLKNSSYTGGNIFLVHTDVFRNSTGSIEKLFKGRKKPLSMIQVLGIVFLFKFLFRLLDVPDIEKRCSEIFKGKSVGIKKASPRLAFDIDTWEDYIRLLNYLNSSK